MGKADKAAGMCKRSSQIKKQITQRERNMIDLHMHSSYSDDGEYSPSELSSVSGIDV